MLIEIIRLQAFCLLIGILGASAVYAGAQDYQYIELVYSENNPDEKNLTNGTGFTLAGSMHLNSRFYSFGWLNHAEVELCWLECFKQSRIIHTMNDWLMLGLGYHWPLRDNTDLTAAINYQSAELDGSREHGGGILLGVRTRPVEALNLAVQAGYFRLEFDDFQIIGEATYQITEHLDFVGRIRDFNDWDYSSYEGGLRYRF